MRPSWDGETCDCCTREQRLAWGVSDELWTKVVIEYYRKRILCLECFLRMAHDKGIDISPNDIIITGIVTKEGK